MKNNLRELRDQYIAELERVSEEVHDKYIDGNETFTAEQAQDLAVFTSYVAIIVAGSEDVDDAISGITEFGELDE